MTSPLLLDAARVALIGIGATAALDLWQLLLSRRFGVAAPNWAYVGRWAGHLLRRGQLAHAAIAQAPPLRGELALGWLVHYTVGIAFAGLLAVLAGTGWAAQPTLLPALAVGCASVAAPLLLLQPAMGAGIASSKTPTPLRNGLRSLANHAVFGLGLYLAAAAIAWATR